MDGYRESAARGFDYAYSGAGLLHSEQSRFQRLDVYDHPAFGRMLVLDGLTQTTERDEFIYHEMLVHVPLLCLAEPRSVLIVGGGDGGTLRHALMHPTVERAVMVEIDERVTAVCREWIPGISAGALDDPRADVRFDDGAAFVRSDGETFDAILIDSSDPVGPGVALFTGDFYAAALRRLAPGGLLAAQSGGPFFQQRELHRAYRNAAASFPDTRVYLANVPTYPGTLWSFLLCGERIEVDADAATERASKRWLSFRYWTPELHAGCFALPRIVRDVLAPDGPPLTWGLSPEEDSHG